MAAPILRLEGVHHAFGGLVAVDDLTLDVEGGTILGLIGPNGSGKTTVLNLISGAIDLQAGAIRYRARAIGGLAPHRIARLGIARTFQLVRVLPQMDVIENVTTGLAFRTQPMWGAAARRAAEDLLGRVGLSVAPGTRAGALTYVDQKRLELARALALDPQVILLDEWLAGLNPTELNAGIATVRGLRDAGITVILVEHVMDAIRSLSDRCAVMNAGRLIAVGTPTEVLADPEVVRAYLGDGDA